jgi:hypothetical protein
VQVRNTDEIWIPTIQDGAEICWTTVLTEDNSADGAENDSVASEDIENEETEAAGEKSDVKPTDPQPSASDPQPSTSDPQPSTSLGVGSSTANDEDAKQVSICQNTCSIRLDLTKTHDCAVHLSNLL